MAPHPAISQLRRLQWLARELGHCVERLQTLFDDPPQGRRQASGSIPFSEWADVPLVCNKATTARVLNMSLRTLSRELKAGTMQPAPMPGRGSRRVWSKAILQQWVDGGYQKLGARRRR